MPVVAWLLAVAWVAWLAGDRLLVGGPLVVWLLAWLVGWLIGWLVGWLAGWQLAGRLLVGGSLVVWLVGGR